MNLEEFQNLKSINSKFTLIDIREVYEFEHENLGGKNIPMGELLNRLDEIPKDEMVVLHCQSGSRAKKMSEVLHIMGYSNISYLEGSIEDFKPCLYD